MENISLQKSEYLTLMLTASTTPLLRFWFSSIENTSEIAKQTS